MKLYANQLPQQLTKGIQPCYLLFGDEPFQIDDSRRKIRAAAKQQGFEEFIRLSDDDQFDWSELQQHCQSMSLFSSKKLIELELTHTKLPTAGADVIKKIAVELDADTVLVIFGQKLDNSQTRNAWFKALDKIGCYVPVYDIQGPHLERWLKQQLKERSISMNQQAQFYLLDYTRGNLLACAQELDKLHMVLGGSQVIELAHVQEYVADQSRYSVFQLIDSLWAGNTQSCITILQRLKAEELEPNIIMWSLQKDVTLILQLAEAQQYGLELEKVFDKARVWKNKQQGYLRASQIIPLEVLNAAVEKLNQIDLALKSSQSGCPYTQFTHVCMMLTGHMGLKDLALPLVMEH